MLLWKLFFACALTFAATSARADDRLATVEAVNGADLAIVERPFAVAVAYPGVRQVGRLVKSSRVSQTSLPIEHAPAIIEAARANGVDPWLLAAVIQVESASRIQAVSPKGARGLMQMMPGTARAVGVADAQSLFDPAINVEAGARHLRALHARFGSLRLVLAAYNAGETAVRRYNGVPPFAETTAYVARVLARYRAFGGRA